MAVNTLIKFVLIILIQFPYERNQFPQLHSLKIIYNSNSFGSALVVLASTQIFGLFSEGRRRRTL
jgi:hypothetical protein